MKICYFQE